MQLRKMSKNFITTIISLIVSISVNAQWKVGSYNKSYTDEKVKYIEFSSKTPVEYIIRYYDKVKEKYVVLNVPLNGFTSAYNKLK